MAITAAQVKELREKTGAGVMDAKIATAVAGSVTIGGNAVLGICARFIKEEK